MQFKLYLSLFYLLFFFPIFFFFFFFHLSLWYLVPSMFSLAFEENLTHHHSPMSLKLSPPLCTGQKQSLIFHLAWRKMHLQFLLRWERLNYLAVDTKKHRLAVPCLFATVMILRDDKNVFIIVRIDVKRWYICRVSKLCIEYWTITELQ